MMASTVFLDCEFTSLASPLLLSVGLSGLDGAEFYGEYALGSSKLKQLVRKANTFSQDTVLPQFGVLPQAYETSLELAKAVASWLASLPAPVQVAYDYGADFELLERLLQENHLWTSLEPRLVPTHVAYLWGDDSAQAAADESWRNTFAEHYVERHHALADARALKAAYRAVHGD